MTEYEVTVRFDSRDDALRFVREVDARVAGVVVDVSPVLDA